MEETKISYETAALAHEKGFKYPVVNIYPQSVLQRWLRDQKILVHVYPGDNWEDWAFKILAEDAMAPFFVAVNRYDVSYPSYEECLEVGLLEALKLI